MAAPSPREQARRIMSTRTELLPTVEVGPQGPCDAAVLWLHGLGADGHDFEPIVPELGLDPRLRVRFVFPHAPSIPVSLNNGWVMPAWYDIKDVDLRHRHDEQGIRESARRIEALIAREVERGVPTRKIVLAGFSQGGAVAVHVGLRHTQPLAGLVALSTYLVGGDTLEAEKSSANRGIPVFCAHGTEDPMVRLERGVALRDRLIELGCDVTWRDYPMPHSVCLEEIVEIGAWLQQRLGG
jgi:phospholipase/carboxylesterase